MLKYTNNISLFIAFCFFAYSCNTYQYYTVNGTLQKSQFSDFFFENDTLQIIYTFNGTNGPVTTKIYNKLEIPLYINWDQSFSNINGDEFFYTQNKDAYNNTEDMERFNTTSFPKTECIDPQTQLITVHTDLNDQFINIDNSQNHDFIYKYNPHSEYPSKLKEYYFSKDESPIFYKNNICYSVSLDKKDLNYVESEFWVSKIYKSTKREIPDSPDMFMVTKINNTGITIGITAIALISFLSVLAVPSPQNVQ